MDTLPRSRTAMGDKRLLSRAHHYSDCAQYSVRHLDGEGNDGRRLGDNDAG